ncbi:MAG TPA: phosphate signaling complex protein PhoU [Blastocatellia bacterium]|nr:phosphate signaling complex protein PhoU [Blastocatellia bacterium]
MNSLIEADLRQIQEHVVLMGREVEAALERAMQAFMTQDLELARRVIADDDHIDALELAADQLGIRVLALKTPEARDLRFVVSASKIATHLERLGDHACNLARAAIDLKSQPPVKIHSDLPEMARVARAMLHEALDAFASSDAAAARAIIDRDDEIDLLYDRVFQELLDQAALDPNAAASITRLVLVAKNLEQIGDRAKDICDEIVYFKEASVIKHSRLIRAEDR